jgi:glycosyltransferase involved in cell wall biosynthesis
VHHKIRRDERDDYPRTARSLERCADVVDIQFADRIWGGDDGEAVLDFVGPLKLPAIATLHTLASAPTARQREILGELIGSVAAVVVMSDVAAAVLTNTYGVDPERVEVIPYGVPDLPLTTTDVAKSSVGLADRDVILSFGLIGPDKGYELVIDALPAIVKANPKAIYVILGATHPDVRLRDGEAYRTALAKRAAALKMTNHVRFVPEHVGRVELARWLQSADVFVTPRPDMDTLGSGTLAQAMAAGRAIVATRYAYAAEMLADGRGVLTDPAPAALAAAITNVLEDEPARTAMGAKAHEHTRPMVWTRIGAVYQDLFTRVASGAPLVARGRGVRIAHKPIAQGR